MKMAISTVLVAFLWAAPAFAQPTPEQAMAALEAADRDHAEPGEAESQALIKAFESIKPDDPLAARARVLIEAHKAELAPTHKQPLKQDHALARTLLHLQVLLDGKTPPDRVAASPAAAEFPGAVPADARRVTRELEVALGVPGWQGTGLYAAPGGVVTVTMPDDLPADALRARIGCHTDHLWRLDHWDRVPEIVRTFKLKAGENRIASPYGGPVYFERSGGGRNDRRMKAMVTGAVASPRFVLGRTSADEWKSGESGRGAPGPWAELESSKIIVTVPSDRVRALDDPGAVMQFWDRISDAHATLAQIPLERERPERYVADVQISAGYMHSGYPIMTHLDAAAPMVSVEKLESGQWGLLHELGHNHQSGDWTFGGTTEVTCNLFSLHAIDTVCKPKPGTRGHGAVDKPPSVKEYIEKGADFEAWKKDPFLALQMYVQMQREFGWDTFKKVFAEYRALPKDQHPKTDDEKRDQWMVRFSRACGKNLGPFFQKWGVPTSEAARKSIKDLPTWMPDELR